MTDAELGRLLWLVAPINIDEFADIYAERVLCDNCSLMPKCPCFVETNDIESSVFTTDACEQIIKDFIRSGEIVDRLHNTREVIL